MCCDTPSQRSLTHVPEQPRLAILLETKNDPFQLRFHASKSCKKMKKIKKQTLFQTFGKLECLENSNLFKFIGCMQCFVFKTVKERCPSHNKKQRTSTEDKFKTFKEIENGQPKL